MKKSLLLFFILINYAYSQTYFPPKNNSSWETISPLSLGWNTNELKSLQNYLEGKNTKAFIILKNGKIAVEWYFNTFTKDSLWYWASAGKTITSFLIGKAEEEGFLKISDPTSKYLGKGWTSLTQSKEDLITIKHQLTMTTGLDDGVSDDYCTLKSCLQFKADAGTRWAYHNAPYTLLRSVIENATGINENIYTAAKLTNKIGMNGSWIKNGYNYVYYSNARSMARFGLLAMNNFVWDGEALLNNQQYINDMSATSQPMNKSYGYLWWLNGKGSYMLPSIQLVFNTNMMPNAPSDMFAGLGKNDQKIYVIKSMGLVVIRMGNAADNPMLALSSFDNELWGEINKVIGTSTSVKNFDLSDEIPAGFLLSQNYPNPFNPSTVIKYHIPTASHVTLKVFDVLGREVATLVNEYQQPGIYQVLFNASHNQKILPSGNYYCRIQSDSYNQSIKMVYLK